MSSPVGYPQGNSLKMFTDGTYGAGDIPVGVTNKKLVPLYAIPSDGGVEVSGVDEYRLPATLGTLQFVRTTPLKKVYPPYPDAYPAPKHVVHPGGTYIPGGWCGWRWVKLYTPYPAGDSAYENPVFVVSNDGDNWYIPQGGKQVIVEKPLQGYNSDTNLTLHPDGKTLVGIYRSRNDGNYSRLYVMTATAPDVWSAPVEIWKGQLATENDMASPSIWWNPAVSKWEVVGHNVDGVAAWPLRKITSSDLFSGWDVTPTALNFPSKAGRRWWHSDFKRLSSGQVVGLAQDNNGTNGGLGDVYFATSDDGTNFYYGNKLDAVGTWYRPCLAGIRENKRTGEIILDAYLSQINKTFFSRVTEKLIPSRSAASELNTVQATISSATSSPSAVLWADDFNRADDATGLGTAVSGGSYTQYDAGNKVVVAGGRAGNGTSGNCKASADVTVSDFIYSAIVSASGTQGWMMIRASDTSNYWRLGWSQPGGPLILQSIVAGAVVKFITFDNTVIAAGDSLTVEARGNSLNVWQNGIYLGGVIDPFNVTATRVGIQASGATASYFDAIAVRRA